jgi:TniQ
MECIRTLQQSLKFPHRTPLFPLFPIGSGTPLVECISGYISRLAWGHSVLISDFLEVPCLVAIETRNVDRRTRRRLFHASSFMIDGSPTHTPNWISALQAATGIMSFRDHTILPYVQLSSSSWLRIWEAWCPQCLKEWRFQEAVVYKPLLWAIKAASVCPIHLCALSEICPACNGRHRPLTNASQVGYCGRCHHWLGSDSSVISIHRVAISSDALAIWSSNQIGKLLAAVPGISRTLSSNEVCRSLRGIIEGNPSKSGDLLSHAMGITRRSLTTWSVGQVLPRLDGLCRISFHLGIPLLDLVQGNLPAGLIRTSVSRLFDSRDLDLSRSNGRSGTGLRNANLTPMNVGVKLPHFQAAQALEDALAETPPPSLYRLAKRLGYANSISLKRHHPDACVELTSKRIAWRQHTLDQLRSKLEEALFDEVPRAVKQICRDIGVREKVILTRFPDLKRKLRDRHTAWLATDRSRKQLELEFAVKTAVQRVQDRGEYPSANNILADSNSLKFAGWERLQAAINKARKA